MYCSGCGQLVPPNFAACPHCGRPVPEAPFVPPQVYRVQRHLQTLGILWLAYAAWSALGWLIALPFLAGTFGGRHWGRGFGEFGGMWFGHMPWFVPLVTTIVVFRTALSLVTGIALLRRAPWGRTLAIVAAILTLIKPISGTILAIYTLWVLLPSSSAQEYERLAVP